MKNTESHKYIIVSAYERDLNINPKILDDEDEAVKTMCDDFVEYLDDIDRLDCLDDNGINEITADIMYSMINNGDRTDNESIEFSKSTPNENIVALGWSNLHNRNFDIAVFKINS